MIAKWLGPGGSAVGVILANQNKKSPIPDTTTTRVILLVGLLSCLALVVFGWYAVHRLRKK